jgi:5-methylcytosine-specific restriction endonuclease McrA
VLMSEYYDSLETEIEKKEYIREVFGRRCIRCRRTGFDVHEIKPRSHGKHTLAFHNRVVLCNNCHDWVHTMGVSQEMMNNLREMRKKRLMEMYGETE